MSIYLSVTALTHALSDAQSAESKKIAEEGAECAPESGRPAIREALVDAHRRMRDRRRSVARVRSSNPLFSEWIDRSLADLGLLTTDLETGPYPYAGIPWFSTVFGRDGIITALQTCGSTRASRAACSSIWPPRRRSASTRADAEPGKILHESAQRRDGAARRSAVRPLLRQHRRDAAVRHAGRAPIYERTGDIERSVEAVAQHRARLGWIETTATATATASSSSRATQHGLVNQGWKDSHDSSSTRTASLGPGRRSRWSRSRPTSTPPGARAAIAGALGHADDARQLARRPARCSSASTRLLVRGARHLRAGSRCDKKPCRVAVQRRPRAVRRHRRPSAPGAGRDAD